MYLTALMLGLRARLHKVPNSDILQLKQSKSDTHHIEHYSWVQCTHSDLEDKKAFKMFTPKHYFVKLFAGCAVNSDNIFTF